MLGLIGKRETAGARSERVSDRSGIGWRAVVNDDAHVLAGPTDIFDGGRYADVLARHVDHDEVRRLFKQRSQLCQVLGMARPYRNAAIAQQVDGGLGCFLEVIDQQQAQDVVRSVHRDTLGQRPIVGDVRPERKVLFTAAAAHWQRSVLPPAQVIAAFSRLAPQFHEPGAEPGSPVIAVATIRPTPLQPRR